MLNLVSINVQLQQLMELTLQLDINERNTLATLARKFALGLLIQISLCDSCFMKGVDTPHRMPLRITRKYPENSEL